MRAEPRTLLRVLALLLAWMAAGGAWAQAGGGASPPGLPLVIAQGAGGTSYSVPV